MDDLKRRKLMDACSHRETAAHVRALQGHRAPGAKNAGLLPPGMKQQLMSAVSSAETIAHAGMVKLTGAVAVYAAHIRQMDEPNRRQRTPPPRRRDDLGREA